MSWRISDGSESMHRRDGYAETSKSSVRGRFRDGKGRLVRGILWLLSSFAFGCSTTLRHSTARQKMKNREFILT